MNLKTELGNVSVSNEVIATIAGASATECFGLVGMQSRKQVRDGISDLLGRENLGKGVEITEEDGQLYIELFIVVSFGTKIHQVAQNVIDTVKYSVQKLTGLEVRHVKVNVQGVKVDNS
ncbi:Asp23/Gls24 family envelope stress response protein [Proteinivorax tanatarense]|uniref:Asp23/Gls24 family envelope stress response protein n=1 Tax=Proteinivorax tanatarense TaxID=1260629 RepID=A0AAU7VPT5_9FIRM